MNLDLPHDTANLIGRLLVYFVPTILSLALHEFGHAASAVALGDPTPREQGRLTLNPLVHVDLFGTILLPLALLLANASPFGWAKPVMITPHRFRRGIRMSTGLMLTAAAGPLMNLLLAGACALGVAYGESRGQFPGGEPGIRLVARALELNVLLCFFNLLPLPPLDGSRVLAGLLPVSMRGGFSRLERIAPAFVALLFFTGIGSELVEGPAEKVALGLIDFARHLFPTT